MSLDEVIEMYEESTATIFPSKSRSVRAWWPERLTFFKMPGPPVPLPYPYSQDGLEKVLKERFGDQSLTSVRADTEPCIAAAVARRQNPPDLPELEIFDTRLERSHRVLEVLKASACAPVFFTAPTSISGIDYIDGGVGGNCPLAQAIPRMRELADDGSLLQTVLSIAPPGEADEKGPKSQFAWLSWFPGQLTDGYPVYLGQEKANPEAIFLRISPQSKETKVFKMDSWDIGGMKESMR